MTNTFEPATPRQTWALFCFTKEDHRNKGLSKQEASELIERLSKENRKDGYSPRIAKDVNDDYKVIFEKARSAAEAACEEWFSKAKPAFRVVDDPAWLPKGAVQRDYGTMLDVCAISGGSIDGRSKFAKWLVKTNPERYGGGNFYGIAYDLLGKFRNRQEMGAQEAGLSAARKVLSEHGVKVRLWTNID